jgi:predicted Ser/Thr protein kinase
MGLATDESYNDLFARYITNVSHWVKHEKIRDPASGQIRDPDESLMSDIERVLMNPGERKEDFRKSVIGTIGARSLDNPSQAPNYSEIFRSYIQRLREDFYATRKKVLRKLNENFLKYASDDAKGLEGKDLEQAAVMMQRLKSNYGYCEHCARDTVAYLLKKRYADE